MYVFSRDFSRCKGTCYWGFSFWGSYYRFLPRKFSHDIANVCREDTWGIVGLCREDTRDNYFFTEMFLGSRNRSETETKTGG